MQSQQTASQHSQRSFDSSVELEQLQLTQTTQSVSQEQIRCAIDSHQQFLQSDKFVKSPFREKSQMQNPPFFLGFKDGFKMTEITVNQSKLKKARFLFEEDQLQEAQSLPQFNILSFPEQNSKKQQKQSVRRMMEPQYSMPCFKTVGRGLQVKISQQAKQKASKLLKSVGKPTRIKNGSNFMDQTIIKTVKSPYKCKEQYVQKQIKPSIPIFPIMQRKSFNWQQYMTQFNDFIDKSCMKKSNKKPRKTQPKNKNYSKSNKQLYQFKFVKLNMLECDSNQDYKNSIQLRKKTQFIQQNKFSHQAHTCNVFQCLLCKIKYEGVDITKNELYNIMVQFFAKNHVKYEHFCQIFQIVIFKLMRYQQYWPQIINKRCNLSNLIVQINKKLIQLQKNQQISYLKYLFKRDLIGRKVNVVVMKKQFNSEMQIQFLKLSDGWSIVWAAIQIKNLLYHHIIKDKKLRIGSKISLCLWKKHAISNILDFCSQAKENQQCIQICYNGSILLHPNSKLGFTPQIFYRPLSKCKFKGGPIPTLQGSVIRIFTIKDENNRKTDYRMSKQYAQILLPQGITCLIKFTLNQQSSLVEYFRLYRTYFFTKLVLNSDGILSYVMDQSKYQQTDSQNINEKKLIYPQKIVQYLKKRFANRIQQQKLIIGQTYDFQIQKGKLYIEEKQYKLQILDDKPDQSNSTNNLLYQQMKLIKLQNQFVAFQKTKYTSVLRRVPKIYEEIIKNKLK